MRKQYIKFLISFIFIFIFYQITYTQNLYNNSNMISHMGSWRGITKWRAFEPNSIGAFINSGLSSFYACEGDLRYSPGLNLFYMSHDIPDSADDIRKSCTFEEYLDICKKYNMRPLIDMKEWGYEDEMWQIIYKKGMEKEVICQQNYSNPIKWLASKGIETCQLIRAKDIINKTWLDNCKSINTKLINIDNNLLTRDIIYMAHLNNIKVCTYSIDDEDDRIRFISWGVDYIMTNKNY